GGPVSPRWISPESNVHQQSVHPAIPVRVGSRHRRLHHSPVIPLLAWPPTPLPATFPSRFREPPEPVLPRASPRSTLALRRWLYGPAGRLVPPQASTKSLRPPQAP